jgi:hypothetical protein
MPNNYKTQFGNSGGSPGFNSQLAPSTSYWNGANGNNGASIGSPLGPSGSASFAPNSASANAFGSFPNNGLYSGFQAAASSHSNVYSQPGPNTLNGNSNGNGNSNSNSNMNNNLNGNMNGGNLNSAGSSASSSSMRNPDNNQYQRSGSGPSNFKPVSSAAIFSASAPIGSSISGQVPANSPSGPVSSSSFGSSSQASGPASGSVSAAKPSTY